MRRGRVVAVLTASLATLCALSALGAGSASAVGSGLPIPGQGPPADTWGRAIEVPGPAALNTSANAVVFSVSCPSAGNCVAGGYYTDGSSRNQAFVASERNGRWRTAIEVPGSAALNTSGNAVVLSVSCPSAGNCAVGGYYTSGSARNQAFVASERKGRWGKATEVPGTAALNVRGNAWVNSVSCPSAGYCAAGGFYTDNDFDIQAFVASERNGRWRTALEVPGSAWLNASGNAVVLSVSCPSAGNCGAGGEYSDRFSRFQAFVASERNGRWSTAIKVPGSAQLNAGGNAQVFSVSCSSAGNCAAGGYYTDRASRIQAFVVSERTGRWRTAIEMPGSAARNAGGNAVVLSVSCPSAGNCAAGGDYADRLSRFQAFVASERNGRWTTAIKVPGSAQLNAGGNAQVFSVSCPSAGNCAAGGYYTDRSSRSEAFVVSERNGRWRKATPVPGI